MVGFAAAAGDASRSRRAYIDTITERARRAEETKESEARSRVAEERLKIARDLHDVMAHQIAVISMHAGVASQALPTRPDDAERALATIRQAARTVLGEIASLLRVLRAADPSRAGQAPDSRRCRDCLSCRGWSPTSLEVVSGSTCAWWVSPSSYQQRWTWSPTE